MRNRHACHAVASRRLAPACPGGAAPVVRPYTAREVSDRMLPHTFPARLPCRPRTPRLALAESPSTQSCAWSYRFFERLANGLVTDRIDHFQGHHFVGEQVQGPVSIPPWRLPQSHGDQLRFALAIELARRGRFLAFLPVQRQCKAFGDQALAESLDRVHAGVGGLGNRDIRPPSPISIWLEED